MSAVFGIFRRDGCPVTPSAMEAMRSAMVDWGPDGCDMLLDGPVAMGRMLFFGVPEERNRLKNRIDTGDGIIFSAVGRVDNRDELAAEIGSRISRDEIAGASDAEILRLAYRTWGASCSERIYGDWAFAAYDRKERRLVLSRDHFGNTSLYYHADSRVFAFASSRSALLALDLAPREMDELYLAQILVSWFAYHGERTIHREVRRLPPGHYVTVTPGRLELQRYWKLEETPELRLPVRDDYALALREVFDEAVRCRLRSVGDIAVTLSGGLDSGAVAATAARFMHGNGKRLIAFTSSPLSNPAAYVGDRFGDEFPLARATAGYSGNLDLHPVTADAITPIQAIRRILTISDEPSHGAGNLFWIQDLMESARRLGCRTLLTGQMGNAGMSWGGDIFSQPFMVQLRNFGWRRWVREAAKRHLPVSMMKAYKSMRTDRDEWWRSTAINPHFADRLDLLDRLLSAPDSFMAPRPQSPFERRCLLIRPAGSFVGGVWSEVGAAFGLQVRDPCADVRVLRFIFSVPDRIFIDPKTGLDRWLIREAMRERLPDEVRLNRRRGRQAGDRVPRLRVCAEEVECVLEELASGPATEYVNVPHMREVWRLIQTDDTPEAFRKSASILTRGIMAGLWVNRFFNAA